MKTAADILIQMADTYRERTALYGGNFETVGKLLAALFPDGVEPALLHSPIFHLFMQQLNKIARFAATDCTHADSVHDCAVYGAIIESLLQPKPKQGELPL